MPASKLINLIPSIVPEKARKTGNCLGIAQTKPGMKGGIITGGCQTQMSLCRSEPFLAATFFMQRNSIGLFSTFNSAWR